ncbi:bifunctional methylenetetrahydrofolate dehydrogenase/methenyltetrahydrofolate cyclohydrolase [Roseospira marina]|uniref:Bifunctional protein FolD n=1 Tax=Roseospira marina TaxID=140057 RepID=A0A5M6I854_9PROT|nr:tetrahydrofolate dehydrogenase/cyclohydrolase catalytic domain-containing protein [Roseospira marina]KAA5604332.1 bifunctional methylenetetrahydrofolate dehydrogenase/methenyltetrahydrofolate cyclohydrolase [Roseospira marina]MBB4315643.1 methylenetetrahydrofolate dehydrogenase (NADP+)/methenyltetrahydrofolate cyclohydrolase [Roseospira marina]MBB5088701.1 methylenetetrahydrofolate dehydrogenase (NADP+)/methenyltetrahydrofolate cyclohydrolase [Roseospira marina]
MTSGARIIEGHDIAREMLRDVHGDVHDLSEVHRITATLAMVVVGDDANTLRLIENKRKRAEEAGVRIQLHTLPQETSDDEVITVIEGLNNDNQVHGILIQHYLPRYRDARRLIEAVDPAKDVDGFHTRNAGLLANDAPAFVPCEALAGVHLIKHFVEARPIGWRALVVGDTHRTGRPAARLLLNDRCTVTIANEDTRDLPEISRQADILIAATNRAGMIRPQHVKPGAAVIDLGRSRVTVNDELRIVGDVRFDEVREVAGWVTPVPGGVGPVAIAMLMRSVVTACRRQNRLDEKARHGA